MKKLIVLTLLLCTQPAFALLPPLNQSIQELKGILNNNDLEEYLPSGEKIQSIEAVKNGYLVNTQRYSMLVQVQYQKQTQPGPAQFTLFFHEPTRLAE